MDIELNEQAIVLKSINENYIDLQKPTNTIKVLIKYYYSIGMDKEQIRNQIENFMKQNYPDFNSTSWQELLDKMVKTFAKEKYNLVKIDSVNITKAELEKIKELNNVKLEKIAFVLMVYAKVLNKINPKNDNWINKDASIIFKNAMVNEKSKQQELLLKQLADLEFIKIPLMVDGTSIQVNYINEQSDVIYKIEDFRDFILVYEKYKGEKIGNCTECNKLIRITNNKRKYCNTCFKDVKNKKNKEYYNIRKIENA